MFVFARFFCCKNNTKKFAYKKAETFAQYAFAIRYFELLYRIESSVGCFVCCNLLFQLFGGYFNSLVGKDAYSTKLFNIPCHLGLNEI